MRSEPREGAEKARPEHAGEPPLPRLPGLAAALAAGAIAVCAAGLAVDLGYYLGGWPGWASELFSLSFEANVPTWYSTCLLFACGVLLALSAARAGAETRAHFAGLAALFVYFSLDEAIEIHEHLGGSLGTSGVLYFDWVVPAAAFVAVVGLAYARFLFRLLPETRRGFVLAGALYVSGALLMELPLGAWTERAGDDNLGYALIDFVEEALEIAGASVFAWVLARHLASGLGDPRAPRGDAPPQ